MRDNNMDITNKATITLVLTNSEYEETLKLLELGKKFQALKKEIPVKYPSFGTKPYIAMSSEDLYNLLGKYFLVGY